MKSGLTDGIEGIMKWYVYLWKGDKAFFNNWNILSPTEIWTTLQSVPVKSL